MKVSLERRCLHSFSAKYICKFSSLLSFFCICAVFSLFFFFITVSIKTLGWARVKHHCLLFIAIDCPAVPFVYMSSHMTVYTFNVIKIYIYADCRHTSTHTHTQVWKTVAYFKMIYFAHVINNTVRYSYAIWPREGKAGANIDNWLQTTDSWT